VKSPKLKLVAALVVMFLLGAVTGGGLSTFLHPYFFSHPQPGDIEKHLTNALIVRLNLAPDQQEKLKPIVADFALQLQAFQKQQIDQLNQLASATDDRISEFLTPEQKLELQKLSKEREEFAKHGPPFVPPFGPPPGAPPGP
jgi:hypothetical protein